MVTRTNTYRVKYIDGAWMVFDAEGAPVSDRLRSQVDAVIHAKELARRDGVARIIVHDDRDLVTSEFFYQREERHALAADDRIPTLAATEPVRRKAAGGAR